MKKSPVLTHSTITVTKDMKSSLLSFVFLAAALSLVCGQKDGEAENENASGGRKDGKPNESLKTNPESKSSGKSVESSQRRPEFLLTPDDRLIIGPRLQASPFPEPSFQGGGFPGLGFSNQRQNYYDGGQYGGQYDGQLRNFQTAHKPADFNAVLGAVSAQILGQRGNQEYVPYPPNGDPYNYPAYRGYPRATEPPAVRAYETASSANYGAQPAANFGHYSPRRAFSNNGYHSAFPNQFDQFGLGFYNNPYAFNDGGFYSGLRRNDESVYDDEFNDEQRRHFRRPIKRSAHFGKPFYRK